MANDSLDGLMKKDRPEQPRMIRNDREKADRAPAGSWVHPYAARQCL